MNIAVSFPGCHRRGGVERVTLECANFLHRRGHAVHLYASEWDDEQLDRGVTRHRVWSAKMPPPLRLITFANRSRSRLRETRPPPQVLSSFGIQSPPGGVLWVQSVHKAWIELSARSRNLAGRLRQRANPFHPAVLALERYHFAGRRYRKLIALSPDVKADLMRLYDIPQQDIEIIPNGFLPSEFNLDRVDRLRQSTRQRLGYGERDRVIVFAANELERKGFQPLLRAMSLLKHPSVHLLAVGRLNRAAVAGPIAELGLADRVQFVGSSSNVTEYYAAADVFALPTQYEAWGLVLVEAMACGLPVVTSRLAGAAVAVSDGRSGYLLDDPRDPREIATKLALALEGSHAPREWIAESVLAYAWSNVLLSYERLLESCRDTAVAC